MKDKKVKILIICICMLAAGICYIFGCGLPESEGVSPFQISEADEKTEETKAIAGNAEAETDIISSGGTSDSETMTEAPGIFVHICGEVKKPGVYEVAQGSRVFEAVEQAGGFNDQAAPDYLNLAQIVTDGMKITVPDEATARTLAEAAPVQGMPQSSGKVNINTATKEQLMTLQGIGEARASDIIAYRQQNGSFDKIEDIMEVSGIKEAAFQKIKENITV